MYTLSTSQKEVFHMNNKLNDLLNQLNDLLNETVAIKGIKYTIAH